MKHTFLAAIAAAALLGGACSQAPTGWSVSGSVAQADSAALVLEGCNNGHWYIIDTLELTSDGSFEYTADAPAAYPDIMRISLNGQSIYFPVDSIDNVQISTNAAEFAANYTLSGSADAAAIYSLDSLINQSIEKVGVDSTLVSATLKYQLFTTAFANQQSVMPLYYLINRTVGQKPLFDINNQADLRLYGAVAQRFNITRPDDPRAAFMAQTYKQALAARSNTTTEIALPTASLPADIVRYDVNGNKRSLVEAASKGNILILSFTSYQLESSPAYNAILNTIWEKHHAAGLDIYQIAFDADESMWKIRAKSLPWTAVWNSTTDGDAVLLNYNVGALPMTFIIDRSGSIAERVVDPTTLETTIAKYL